jgi:hypothetical protein
MGVGEQDGRSSAFIPEPRKKVGFDFLPGIEQLANAGRNREITAAKESGSAGCANLCSDARCYSQGGAVKVSDVSSRSMIIPIRT